MDTQCLLRPICPNTCIKSFYDRSKCTNISFSQLQNFDTIDIKYLTVVSLLA